VITPVLIAICILFLLALPVSATEWDPYAELASPDTWDVLKPGQALMFSGADPSHKNMDSGNFLRIEPEGATFEKGDWVLAEMRGPGSITRIQMTGKNPEGEHPRIYGRIKIFVDSKDRPIVDLPMEDFYGKVKPFVPPFATTTSGSYICYLPIPFSRYCKVVVTDHQDRFARRVNGLGQTIPHLYYQICWRKAPAGVKVEPFTMGISPTRERLVKQVAEWFERTPRALDLKSAIWRPGETLEVYSAKGRSVIEQISVASQNIANLRIIIHWDGSDKPAVDVPAWTFFAAGLEPRPFKSLALGFDGKAYSCRFPMPFEKSARVAIKNTGSEEATVSVAVKSSDDWPKRSVSPLRFHAREIDQKVAAGAPDLTILNTKNGPGQYVGVVLCLPMGFLEGNESISVDGGKPCWVGTGTEDYFNGGWYFCFGPYDYPLSGCIHLGDYVTAYRYHLVDAAPFAKSIKVTLQHGGENEIAGRARDVVFSYETPR